MGHLKSLKIWFLVWYFWNFKIFLGNSSTQQIEQRFLNFPKKKKNTKIVTEKKIWEKSDRFKLSNKITPITDHPRHINCLVKLFMHATFPPQVYRDFVELVVGACSHIYGINYAVLLPFETQHWTHVT